MRAPLFIVACLLLGAGAGVGVALVARDPGGATQGQQRGQSRQAADRPLEIEDPEVRKIAGSEAGSFAAQFDALLAREFDDDLERSYLIQLLLIRWIDIDPGEAGAKLVAEDYLIPRFFRAWGVRDVSAALGVALKFERDERKSVAVAAALGGLVGSQPERVLALVRELPEDLISPELLAEVFMNLARRDPAAAMAEAEAWGPESIKGVAVGWAQLDLSAALAWVEDGHGEYLSAVVGEWSKTAPADAIAYLSKQSNPMADRDLAGQILERLASEGEIKLALDWVQKHALSRGAYLVGRVLDGAAGDPVELWRLVREQMHGMSRWDGLVHLGNRWSGAEFEEFFAGASEFAEDEKLASVAMVGAWAKVRFHEALGYARGIEDPEMRRVFMGRVLNDGFSRYAMAVAVESAPDYREYFNAGPEYSDEEVATALLEGELRDPSLSVRATASRFWLVAPDEGARWIASHPRADEAEVGRHAQQLARIWSDRDPQAASAWLASLEPSAARDFAALGLVEAVAPFDPAGAFEWASAIDSAESRRAALEKTFRAWNWQDRAAAEAALDGSGLAEEEKTRLLGLGGDEK
ncbi:MAG: hypothetical protein ACR2RV_15450 [Verrucomicrobiales bacterium]